MHEREPLPEIRLKMLPDTPETITLVKGAGREAAGDRHKLGGDPDWIQGDETPNCAECDEPMTFYGQLDHLGGAEGLKDGGMIYVFLCRECYTTETVLQFH